MAKVLKVFRERYHGYKRYNPGDEYPDDNPERVAYLVKLGFLEPPTKAKRKKGVDLDADPDA